MSDGTALSRGDRNRNDRLARLRLLLPRENAIVGIDLANDKQAAVVADHDSRVIARRRVTCRAWLVWRAREAEDLTWEKSDPKDATLIARLAAERRCYEPERIDATWGRLRHLGARRAALTTDATSSVQQLRDLLECVWPAVLDAAGSPFRSKTWCAALAVVLQRCAGDRAGYDDSATCASPLLSAENCPSGRDFRRTCASCTPCSKHSPTRTA